MKATAKKPRVRGRILRAMPVAWKCVADGHGGDKAEPVLKSFWFELRPDGLHVRRFRARLKDERVWPLAKLANGADRGGQMEMEM